MPLEGPVPRGVVMTDDEKMSLLVEFTRTVELEEPPVPRGADGPAEAKVLVSLPYGAPLAVLKEAMLEGPTPMGAVGPPEPMMVVVVLTEMIDVEEAVLFPDAIELETELEDSLVVLESVGPADIVLLVPLT